MKNNHYTSGDKIILDGRLITLGNPMDRRALPEFWEIGHRVRFLKNKPYAWREGDEGVIKGFHRDHEANTPAKDYQVFYAGFDNGTESSWWTAPDDVEWLP